MTWDVVGVGASCVDHVCRVPVFPEAGGARAKVRLRSESRGTGGQTATALATCRALGLTAKYVGVVGQDDNGESICRDLTARGIDTADVAHTSDAPTATATLLIDDEGERIVLWHRDSRLAFEPGALPRRALETARLVHVDDVDEPAAIEAARIASRAGVPTTCDLDHLTPRSDELLALITVPILAEHVPAQLTGEANIERALRALRQRHPGLLVVTLGSRGAAALSGDTFLCVPAFRVQTVDTTGAGDVFRGGFICAFLSGFPVPEMLRFANAAAAVSCSRPGAMSGIPTLTETREILENGAVLPS